MDSNFPITDCYYEYGNIYDFISLLEARGFIVQEGEVRYVDILKLCSEGVIDSCMGNNTGAPYAMVLLPPAPGQDPALGQEPPVGYDPNNPDNYPANIDYLAPGFNFKLRPDEAIVLIGLTPPPAYYFSFQSYLGFVEDKPGKDYDKAVYDFTDIITAGNADTGYYHQIMASLNNSLNNFFIWTDNTPGGMAGYPYNSATVIITTADAGVNYQIRNTLEAAGFNPYIMNNDNIPGGLVNMGLDKGRDTFTIFIRAALWEDKEIGDNYIKNIGNYLKVFRITPAVPYPNINPWPIPKLRIRETGITEFLVVPTARDDLDFLRDEIIDRYGEGYDHVDLNTKIAIPDDYEGILQDVDTFIDNRDTIYLITDIFQLTSDDDFIIVYGINHERTGKAIYSNASFYGKEYFNGVVGVFSTVEFADSAWEYFPEGYENAKYYYVYKMARKSAEDNVIIIPYSTGNPLGKAYGVDNNKDAFIGFRIYVDKTALVGPAYFAVIWDRAILFTKKKRWRLFSKPK
ncbi:MAG: hypothetical protein UMV23_06220 [Halanaerobium sp.]|nr:hypothetical protein [Halanaerobium sp.]